MTNVLFPGEDVVLSGVDRQLWDRLVKDLAHECGAGNYEWKKYAKKAPWSLRVKRDERVIVYLLPAPEGIQASFALGERALALVREAGFGFLLEGARKYAEGTAVRLLVRENVDAGTVIALAERRLLAKLCISMANSAILTKAFPPETQILGGVRIGRDERFHPRVAVRTN